MRSARPKPLHEVAGRSMLAHALAALVEAGCERIAVVVGPGDAGEALAAEARRLFPAAEIFVQSERRGTAHAVLAARAALAKGADDMLVHYADTPLVTAATLRPPSCGTQRPNRGLGARLRGRRSQGLRPVHRARRRARRHPRAEGRERRRTRDPPLQRRHGRARRRARAGAARRGARRQRRARILSDRRRRDRRFAAVWPPSPASRAKRR